MSLLCYLFALIDLIVILLLWLLWFCELRGVCFKFLICDWCVRLFFGCCSCSFCLFVGCCMVFGFGLCVCGYWWNGLLVLMFGLIAFTFAGLFCLLFLFDVVCWM